jgi:N-acetylglucosaminyldiphosphoundecaprenol N-acetyl-beta-D-mannosaminyltransferase
MSTGARRLFGVRLTTESLDEAVIQVAELAKRREGGSATSLAVHGLIVAVRDADYRSKLERFNVVAADGQPVRWALNTLCGAQIASRVAGTDLMDRLCRVCARERVSIYIYGSTADTNQRLVQALERKYPALSVAGHEPSLFRPLSEQEDSELVERVNSSGAGVLFLGLGCPLQESFASEYLGRLAAVQVCVGAAFNIHAGDRSRAPRYMQASGLEWLYRLYQEPRRLLRRYFTTNLMFIYLFGREIARRMGCASRR